MIARQQAGTAAGNPFCTGESKSIQDPAGRSNQALRNEGPENEQAQPTAAGISMLEPVPGSHQESAPETVAARTASTIASTT